MSAATTVAGTVRKMSSHARPTTSLRRSLFLGTLGSCLLAAGCAFHTSAPGESSNPLQNADGGKIGADGGGIAVDYPVRSLDASYVNAPDVISSDDAGACSRTLHAVVRDFRGWPGPNGEPKHPDFENGNAVHKGIAAAMLGADSKPVYGLPGPTPVTTGAAEYAQWYRDTDGVNMRFEIDIPLTEDPARPGTYLYDNDAFFPIDNQGFGNQNQSHNFSFTTEVHFDFPYRGGEVFTFRGDDDLWLFVNGQLAIDLGGVHSAMEASTNLDQDAAKLGIKPGNTYRMDIFHAERHTSKSTYHIETTLQCITNVVIP